MSSQQTKVVDLREDREMSSLSRSVRVTDLRDDEEEEEEEKVPRKNISEPHCSGRVIRLPKQYETNIIISNTRNGKRL